MRGGLTDVAIVLAHDIFGMHSGRHKQLCDLLAQRLGCVVVMPDLFRGALE